MPEDGHRHSRSAGRAVSGLSVSRRAFLMKGAATGAAVTAFYVAPRITTVLVRPAYASGTPAAPVCLETKLTASDPVGDPNFGNFGRWVAISGDTAVVGASLNDDAGTNSGSAYIFRRDEGGANNWGEVKKLTASDAAAGDLFGEGVAISGDTAIVGAHHDDFGDLLGPGSAYVYQNVV